MTYISSAYYDNIAQGRYSNIASWSKIGYNPNIGTSEEDLWPAGGTYTFPAAAAASVGTAASGLMTLTLQVDGVNTVVLSWAEAELDATASGVPAALTGGETMTAVLATSAGGAGLTANFRGVLS